MSACRRWNEKPAAGKTWKNLDSLQIQLQIPLCSRSPSAQANEGGNASHAGFYSANPDMTHNEYQMAEATIGALANLETATTADRGVVAALNQVKSRLVKQLEETASELRELKALFHQERSDKRGPLSFNPSSSNYCWTHGYKVGKTHTSITCNTHNPGHKAEATRAENMGGSQANKE
jgi:hypothetical protein